MPADQSPFRSAPLAARYAIERELGSGGMATVYLAADLKHRRKVAVKVLRPELSASIGAERFLREIETVARLSHPHILPLYDSGTDGDQLFYVMPFVRGESLRQRLARDGRLPIADALAITLSVARALAFAHGEGVVHRDIKPENIMLHEGEALLADFGIAIAPAAPGDGRLTASGMVVGTPDYMSPEQALGSGAADARTDIYSLGCVFYEMLTGQAPHRAASPRAALAQRVSSPAPEVRRARSEVPPRIARALLRALAPDPDDRFTTVDELIKALTGARGDSLDSGEDPPSRAPAVAVLPFMHLGTDAESETFAEGITEDVIAQLSKIRGLRVISRMSVMRFKRRDTGLREIGATLGASALLDGSVRRAGDRVRIVAQLVDAESDRHLWAETYDRQLTDIFAIQSDVAMHIAGALRAELTRDERARLGKRPTTNIEAYQFYVQARKAFVRFTAAGFHQAIAFYEEAIARDPGFALAHVGRGLAYSELAEIGALPSEVSYVETKRSVARALELDPDLGEAHCLLAVMHFEREYDWEGAAREFRRAKELIPANADLWNLYGRYCSSRGEFDEAIEAQRRAQGLDPLAHRADIATAYLRAGRYEEAETTIRRALVFEPREARGHATLGWSFVLRERFDEGLEELRLAVECAPEALIWRAQLGEALAMAGRIDEARAVLGELEARSSSEYVSPYHLAYIHTGLKEYDRAMDHLERAFEMRTGAIYGIKGAFLFAPLRGLPRFKALLRRMNLE